MVKLEGGRIFPTHFFDKKRPFPPKTWRIKNESGLFYKSLFWVNALPEPDLRYFSNS
jgi:hypothetical protein